MHYSSPFSYFFPSLFINHKKATGHRLDMYVSIFKMTIQRNCFEQKYFCRYIRNHNGSVFIILSTPFSGTIAENSVALKMEYDSFHVDTIKIPKSD